MKIQKIAQKGIVFDKDRSKILLNKYLESKFMSEKLCGKLCLPGGQIDWGEEPDQAFVREIKEETGVEVQAGVPFAVWSWTYEKDGNDKQIVAIARFGYYRSGKIKEPKGEEESKLEKAKWYKIDKLNFKNLVEDEVGIVKKAIQLVHKH